jgi:centromere protein C
MSLGVMYPARLLNPKVVDGEGHFRYQKVFGDDVYMASGILELPAGTGMKPEKSSKDNSYVSLS